MNQPTKEQIQWLWEQCGFSLSCYGMGIAWHINNKKLYSVVEDDQEPYEALPPIDLNNLFKYAVPILRDISKSAAERWGIGMEGLIEGDYRFRLNPPAYGHVHQAVIGEDKDPALALFWAIYKALGGKE